MHSSRGMTEQPSQTRVFYRFVGSNPPKLRDFQSNQEKGLPRRGPERDNPRLWSGVSVWNSPEPIRALAIRHGWRGYIARLEIPDDPAITIEQTFSPGHYTAWAPAAVLRRCVVYPLLDL